MSTAFGAGVVVAGAAFLALIWVLFAWFGPGPAARSGASTDIVFRGGSSVQQIAVGLKQAGLIRSSGLFLIAAKLSGAGRRLQAGEYDFVSHASMAQILAAIRDGRVVRHFVTIPEGVSSEMVMDILTKSDILTGVAPSPPEGAVLPETYEVQRGDDRAEVLQRMMDARDKLLAELWAARRPDLPYKTPEEAVIIASIVEKETAKADERPRVAAVYINRLKAGMPLQADPTVIYGLTGGRPLGHGLTRSELDSQTPYNTYRVAGLPPTPIGNPGRASLAAALDPPRTDELYFVEDGTGGHVFSATVGGQDDNVKKWRVIEAQRKCQAAAAAAGKPAAC
jgi:UPF0755 protein